MQTTFGELKVGDRFRMFDYRPEWEFKKINDDNYFACLNSIWHCQPGLPSVAERGTRCNFPNEMRVEKLEEKKERKVTTFKDVDVGQRFVSENALFLKITPISVPSWHGGEEKVDVGNALNIADGAYVLSTMIEDGPVQLIQEN